MCYEFSIDSVVESTPPPQRACPTSHISPQGTNPILQRGATGSKPLISDSCKSGNRGDVLREAQYTVTFYAHLVEVKEDVKTERQQRGGGLRGKVHGLSKNARRRALKTLCRVRGHGTGVFVTLTYPDEARACWDANKAHLDTFLKRLKRRFPDVGFFWRIEYKRRKSGAHTGEIAPHFHLLLFGLDTELPQFRKWLSLNWYQVVNSGTMKHLAAGTEAKPIRSRKHAMYYVSKYVAKSDEEAIEGLETGRMWGYGGNLILASSSTLVLSRSEYVALRRLVKKWLKSQRSHYANRIGRMEHGLSVMGCGDEPGAALHLGDIMRVLRSPP